MNCVMFGSDNSAPSTSAVNYNGITNNFSGSWSATLNIRQTPFSEDVTITKLIVYLDTAPGVGKSFVFAINDDGSDTAAAVTFNDGSTLTQTWTGSVSVSANSLMAFSSTPSGTPTASTNQYWVIEYTTAGQYFLMTGGSSTVLSTSVASYNPPVGFNSSTASATSTDRYIVIPSGGTITKLVAATPDGSPGVGKSYAFSARTNDTTDNLTTTISDAETIDSVTGSISVSAGDTLVMKMVPSGTPTARRGMYCLTIAPTTNGEVFYGFGGEQNLAGDNTTRYEQLHGNGNNGWNSTENMRYEKPPVVDYKKLYVQVNTAPGVGKTRTFTFRDNVADTTLAATISDAATTGNDTTHTVTYSAGGNPSAMKSTATGTPAATAGVHWGFVMAVAQVGGTSVKTANGLAEASVKTKQDLANASIKSFNGLQ